MHRGDGRGQRGGGYADGQGSAAEFYGQEGIAVTPDGKTVDVADGNGGDGSAYQRIGPSRYPRRRVEVDASAAIAGAIAASRVRPEGSQIRVVRLAWRCSDACLPAVPPLSIGNAIFIELATRPALEASRPSSARRTARFPRPRPSRMQAGQPLGGRKFRDQPVRYRWFVAIGE